MCVSLCSEQGRIRKFLIAYGGFAVSYKSDIQAYTAEWNRRKQTMFLIVKITSVLLALCLIATAALTVVDVLNGDVGHREEQSSNSPSLITAKEKKVTCYVGDTVSYKSFVTYPDGYELEYSSNADLSKAGTYTVSYKLLKDGKVVDTYKLTLILEERNVELESLMSLIGIKAQSMGITKEMSKVEIVKKVYAFVNGGIPYTTTSASHTGDDRSKWEENWIKEATLTLQSMTGDCYSNYSLSKAFFEYFEIENVGIMRAENDGGLDGTHFWSVVNVGTAKNPQWYYYDSTKLAGTFSDGTKNACLVTLDKLWSYHSSLIAEGEAKYTFYAFDPKDYPTVATTPLS